MNPDLVALQKDLLQQHLKLAALLQDPATAADPDKSQTILTEMGEVLHRLDLVQDLLLVAVTASITAALKDLGTQSKALSDALTAGASATNVVNSVSKYLWYVDTAIDIAKLV
jgi:hypothetical protein